MGAESIRAALSAAFELHTESLPALRKQLRELPYDGIHGIPHGIETDLARRFIRAREVVLIQRRNGAVVRLRPAVEVFEWLRLHRAGKVAQIPERMRLSIGILSAAQEVVKGKAKQERMREMNEAEAKAQPVMAAFIFQSSANKSDGEKRAQMIRARATVLLAKNGNRKRGIVKILEVEGHSRPTIKKALIPHPSGHWRKKEM